jgi:hypothetical protein
MNQFVFLPRFEPCAPEYEAAVAMPYRDVLSDALGINSLSLLLRKSRFEVTRSSNSLND